jgi:hypothetical protein
VGDHTLEVSELRETCASSPSQWEGRLSDGRPFYIRYRWGFLSVSIGEVGGLMASAMDANEWFGQQVGDPLDGKISIDDVFRLTGLTLAG